MAPCRKASKVGSSLNDLKAPVSAQLPRHPRRRPGFSSEPLLTADVALPQASYSEAAEQLAFFDELLERVEALPGVTAAGGTSVLPFGNSWSTTSFQIEGYEAPPNTIGPWGDVRMITPDFLTALGAPLWS
jgi:putative ABC transport system permease protein